VTEEEGDDEEEGEEQSQKMPAHAWQQDKGGE